MITIPMTAAQYAKARTIVQDSPRLKEVVEESPTKGHFTSNMITAEYNYDGSNLTLNITAKHGLAKLASDNDIKEHLVTFLEPA
jgi:hypothetical protein